MALSILNNIASLAAQNNLAVTGANLQKTLFRLSSGSRINSGADDAAGLAIADGLQANITGLTQSARNANDGVGQLQVADGALAQVTTLLNRAVTLATESATGTVSNQQRSALDAEFTAIKSEVDRIGSTTNFNGTAVFTAAVQSIFLSDSVTNSTINTTTGTLSALGVGLGANASSTLSAISQPATLDTVTIGASTYTFKTALTASTTAGEVLIGATASATLANLAAAINGGAGSGVAYGSLTTTNLSASAKPDSDGNLALTALVSGVGGNAIASTSSSAAHVGFSSGATFAGGSGTAGLTSAASATAALATINTAIQSVAATRGALGASINRLQSAVNVINNQTQNLSAAQSGIRDADISQEVANLTKYQILNQTGISSLAQANQTQQSVLKLLQ